MTNVMQWIDDIILGIIDLYNTNSPYELCDCLNIEIIKVSPDSLILSGNNSLYIRNYCDNEVIFIRNDLNPHHEEFYLRHELGHAILHVNIANSNLTNLPKLEKQANYFAFKLSQMELDDIELRDLTMEQIACCIEVPYVALKQFMNT